MRKEKNTEVQEDTTRPTDIDRMCEYAAAMKVFLSTLDALKEREYSKSDALEVAQSTMETFLGYKASIEGMQTLVNAQQECESQEA